MSFEEDWREKRKRKKARHIARHDDGRGVLSLARRSGAVGRNP